MAILQINTKNEMYSLPKKGSRGFVPTMGALHRGHLALVRQALAENEEVIVSIFVNPTQFNNAADLAAYPRTLADDLRLLEPLGDLIVFTPTAEEMYARPSSMSLHFGYLETILEGQFRPGHFQGVGEVVGKLFHITQPDRAYFGLKDLQQVAVIQALTSSLDFPVEIVPCETVREVNGLALSSRNQRLSQQGKEGAHDIYAGLVYIASQIKSGEGWENSRKLVWNRWSSKAHWQPEYLEIVRFPDLKPITEPWKNGDQWSICTAVWIGSVRLIDNLLVD